MESSCVSNRTLLTSIVMIVSFLTMLVKVGDSSKTLPRSAQREGLAGEGLVGARPLLEPKRLEGIRPGSSQSRQIRGDER